VNQVHFTDYAAQPGYSKTSR